MHSATRLRIGVLTAMPVLAGFLYMATPASQAQEKRQTQETHIAPAAAKSVTNAAQAAPMTPQYAMVKQYCLGCHNNKVKTAGVTLEGLDTTRVGDDAATWEKVLRKLSANEMPPAGLPRPKPEDRMKFVSWLETSLDQAAAAHPNPGHPTVHRLNRAEYANAIRDLLAVDTKPLVSLPGDDSGYGFDNIGDVLSLSPVLIERYMSAANKIVKVAVGDVHMKPEEDEFFATRDTRTTKQKAKFTRRPERISPDLPFDSAGGTVINYRFPVDATYVIKIKTATPPKADGSPNDPTVSELKIPVKAGERELGVTFLREDELPEVIVNPAALGRRGGGGGPGRGGPPRIATMDVRLDGVRLKTFDVPEGQNGANWSSVSIAGPYDVLGAGDTPSREKIFVCKPANASQEESCARKIISNLGRHAYRRPFTEADLKPLMAFYDSGRKQGTFDDGIEMAIRAMLVSPDFLFRVEHDPPNAAPGTVFRVNDYELASRLSFFLWSSIPDDELLNLAAKNRLHDPEVLQAQVKRMLADEKSDALVSNFAGQWLYLRNLALVTPDPDEFPEFDDTLRAAFLKETEMFFASILRDNRPVTELLSANYSYLNERLAEHYGVKGVYGSQFRRVLLADADRGGLLGQGAILTVTSYPNRTSVVQRGKWVLENLLGTPPPPPPPDVPALEAHNKEGKQLTMRQQMEQHRANPTCAACHSRMDPIGFALENYDGVGKWRTTDAGSKIDPSGKLPDGTTFQGPAGLKNLLLTKDKDEFLETFTEKLMTYALGRGLEYYDRPAMRAVIRDAEAHGNTIQAYINAIVKSQQFQMRRSRES
jgi:cytochrome c5